MAPRQDASSPPERAETPHAACFSRLSAVPAAGFNPPVAAPGPVVRYKAGALRRRRNRAKRPHAACFIRNPGRSVVVEHAPAGPHPPAPSPKTSWERGSSVGPLRRHCRWRELPPNSQDSVSAGWPPFQRQVSTCRWKVPRRGRSNHAGARPASRGLGAGATAPVPGRRWCLTDAGAWPAPHRPRNRPRRFTHAWAHPRAAVPPRGGWRARAPRTLPW